MISDRPRKKPAPLPKMVTYYCECVVRYKEPPGKTVKKDYGGMSLEYTPGDHTPIYEYISFEVDDAWPRRLPHSKVIQTSNRVWKVDGKDVTFYKHRYKDPKETEVDVLEFAQVKLSSKFIN